MLLEDDSGSKSAAQQEAALSRKAAPGFDLCLGTVAAAVKVGAQQGFQQAGDASGDLQGIAGAWGKGMSQQGGVLGRQWRWWQQLGPAPAAAAALL
jgi:hypothetical protein